MAKPQDFKPGDPRINRKGAPKKAWTMSGLIREALEEEDETGTPKKVGVARKLSQLALRGDIVAIKEINNRLDGMSTQTTDLRVKEMPTPLLGAMNVPSNNGSKEAE